MLEYSSNYVGINNLVLIATLLYGCSYIAMRRAKL